MGDPYHDAGGDSMRPHRGTLILILGIVGIAVCFPCGIAAWIMGKGDLQEMAAGRMDPSGEGLTNAGRIIGMVTVALAALSLLMVFGFLILGIGGAMLSGAP